MAGKFKRDKNCLVIMKLQWDEVFHCSDMNGRLKMQIIFLYG